MPTFRNLKTTSAHDSPMTVDEQPIIFGPLLPKPEGRESDTTDTSYHVSTTVDISKTTSISASATASTSTTANASTPANTTINTTALPDADVDMSDALSTIHLKNNPSSRLLDLALPQYIATHKELEQHERDRDTEFFLFYQRKAKSIGLPRPLMIFSRSHCGEVTPFPMPRIYQFADMLHLVRCFRDAVLHHKRMWMDGILHHDVTVYTILLGRVDAPVGLVGKLCESKDPIYIDPLDTRAHDKNDGDEPHPDTQRLSFKSVMELKRIEAPDLEWPATDHLDDMESLLYSLAWIVGYMDGPQRLHLATDVREWETPDACSSGTEKQALLRSPALTHLNTYFWRPAFWRMYNTLADICYSRLRTKFGIMQMVDSGDFDRFPTLQENRAHFGAADHDRFLSVIDKAVAEMEANPDDKNHVKPRRRPKFTFADLRAMSDTYQKRTRARILSEEEELERQMIADTHRKLDQSVAETLGFPFPL